MAEIDGLTESKEDPERRTSGRAARINEGNVSQNGVNDLRIGERIHRSKVELRCWTNFRVGLSNTAEHPAQGLIGTEAGQALAPQQHMRRWPLVAPSQFEFLLESKQFSVGELAGSAKKV